MEKQTEKTPDQTAPISEQSNLGLHGLPKYVCPKI